MLSILKKTLQLLIVTFYISDYNTLNAQRWEIGGLLGGTNYLGDISKDPNITQTRLGVNLWARYNMSRHFSYRFGGAFGQISGHDSLQPAGELRMLGFKSNIWEFTNIIEFNFSPFNLRHPKNVKTTFYVFTGINMFYFNPKGMYQGKWIELQPLGTEGQYLDDGKGSYSRVSVSIPLGAGIKHKLNDWWVIGFEVGYRKTYTDYLDDVSDKYPNLISLRQTGGAAAANMSDPSFGNGGETHSQKNDMRGDPHLKDWYLFAGFTLSYRFVPDGCSFPRKTRRFRNVD